MGIIDAVCMSAEKGVIKKAVERVTFKPDWGIVGDGHAGMWERQISILAAESIERLRAKMPELDHGMFAENMVTSGIDLQALAVGDCLRIGRHVTLEITRIGKECHNSGCAIRRATGECIMPTEGLFCRVVTGGRVSPGMKIKRVAAHRILHRTETR